MTYPPTLQEVKDRCRIEHDIEDADIALIQLAAGAEVEAKVGRPIALTSKTWLIEYPYMAWRGEAVNNFQLPMYPVKHADTDLVVIVDGDGNTVDDATYRVNTETGLVVALGSAVFDTWPYTVTAKCGLALLDDFETRVEPLLNAAYFDLCADWYQRRSPNAFAEGAGGGVITQYNQLGIPDRVCQVLETVRRSLIH